MRTKQILKYGIILVAGLLVLAALTWFLISNWPKPDPPFMEYVPTGPAEVSSPGEYWPTQGWQTGTPEEQGFDSVKLAEGLQDLKEKDYAIDSLLIIRDGRVILDAYFYPYKESLPHDLASVTKSFTTTLVAIAAAQGKLDLDQPMVSYFPGRQIANLDEQKGSITVRNLAGMVNGMESGCLSGDGFTLDDMRSHPDWVQAALDRKMKEAPGDHFCYDSPGMHILSAILQEATGMTELEFARRNLFDPLGIDEVYWDVDPQGYNRGWGDLHLKPRDAAKLGYLFLHQGMWEGKQIVPADWVREAVKVNSETGQAENYGYGWWVSDNGYAAIGRGTQNIRVYPALNMVVVVTSDDFEYETLGKMLDNALLDAEKPLPANPQGVAMLNAQLVKIAQGPGAQAASSLPETARSISGKTYACKSNLGGVNSLRFEFDGLEVADLYMKQNNADVLWPIGLDGEYQLTTTGEGVRGWWEDEQTFIVDLFDIGQLKLEFQFEGDQLSLYVPEAHLTIKCQVQNP